MFFHFEPDKDFAVRCIIIIILSLNISCQIFCLDGDGAVLMHLGSMSTVGSVESENFKHIIINNGCHDSVGGQPTDAANENFSFMGIATACGYKEVLYVGNTIHLLENNFLDGRWRQAKMCI
jgi:hypothetical protein